MVLIRGIYVVVYSTIIIGMFRYIIIIIYEVLTINVRERGTTIEITPKFHRPLPRSIAIDLPSAFTSYV